MRITARGFTLIEVAIVVAVLALIAGIGLAVGLPSYRATLFRSDRDTLIAALLHARAQAMNGVCSASACAGPAPHGVYIGPASYVIFEGASYATRDASEDEAFAADPVVARSGAAEIVFDALSGRVDSPGEIVLAYAGHASIVSIDGEGGVAWTR
jgi:prepilin-type N-terminal cleavage/methylation domain-containing protein